MPVRQLDPKEKADLLRQINSGVDSRGVDRGKPILLGEIERAKIDVENRRITYSFSSETPVDRWWGTEILDHDAKSVDLSRFKSGAMAPLLVDHDWRVERQVGVVEEAVIDEQRKKGYATSRFSKKAFAEEVWQDVQDGIVGNVSVGYELTDIVLEEEKKGAAPVYRVKWTPYENSLVTVPADVKVGVGRAMGEAPTAPASQRKEGIMPPDEPVDTGAAAVAPPATHPTPPDSTAFLEDLRKKDAERTQAIRAIGDQWKEYEGTKLADEFVKSGRTVEEFRTAILDKLEKSGVIRKAESPDIGLSGNDTKRFSLWNAIRAIAIPENREFAEAAAFEREVCRAYMDRNHVASRGEGMVIPGEILRRAIPMSGKRANDLTAGTDNQGKYTVQTDVLGASFVDVLRANAPTMRMGTVLSGLTGNIAIPKKTSGVTAYWVAENVAPTDSTIVFGQIAPTPKHVGTYVDISRLLFLQSSLDIENLVVQDIADTLAQAIDTVAIHGGGSGEPSGLMTLPSGIGNVDMGNGTDGGLPTYAKILAFEATVGTANGIKPGRMTWLMNYKTVGILKSIMRVATYGDVPLWNDMVPQAPVNGYPVEVSGNVKSTLTKGASSGVCSALLFGNFEDLMFFLWDGLDVLRDPYTASAAGTVRIRALQTLDVAVRQAASFCVSDEVLTTGF